MSMILASGVVVFIGTVLLPAPSVTTAPEVRVTTSPTAAPSAWFTAALARPQLAGPAIAADSKALQGFRDEGPRRTLGRQLQIDGVSVKSRMVLPDPDWNNSSPIRRSAWQTEESVRLPFLGPLSVIGQVGVNSESVEWQQYKFTGKTGIAWKLPSWLGGEVQFRTARYLSNYDPDLEVLVPEHARTFFEISTRWPLIRKLNLEYTGEAIPAASDTDRDVLKQDLRLAMPFSASGQIHIGAKYRWVDMSNATPWLGRTRMYIGLEFKH